MVSLNIRPTIVQTFKLKKKYLLKYKNGGLCFENRNHEFGLNMEFWGMENVRNSKKKKKKKDATVTRQNSYTWINC